MKKTYYCQVEGMILGTYQNVNDELRLSDREAKYLVMSGLIATEKKAIETGAPKAPEPSPAILDMKTRKA